MLVVRGYYFLPYSGERVEAAAITTSAAIHLTKWDFD
jgi:hypothetical protein